MQLKIAFTGPESSGKTTISKSFAELVTGKWVAEFAREYLQKKESYQQSDLDEIARLQREKWLVKGNILVADTEMTVIKIWSEYRYNSCSEFIEKAYQEQQFDHYFLCKPDIPWEYDSLRENPDNRDELFNLYHQELLKMNRAFTILQGSIEERLNCCKIVLKPLIPSLNV
jgi:nicotinamide riboside kinase